MKEGLTKRDVISGYISKILSIGAGLFTLPLILRILTEEEIACNYLFVTILSIVALFDFGFSPQFSRNFSFVFGGAQEIVPVGVPTKYSEVISYKLLYELIATAKYLYKILASVVFIFLLTFGTLYVYRFTDGFTLIDNIGLIWIAFAVSVLFDFYYRYFGPLLLGRGQIYERNVAEIMGSLVKIISLSLLIILGFGLWSVVISTFLRVVVSRLLSIYYFYNKEMKLSLSPYTRTDYDKKGMLKILWVNARKMMIVSFATYVSTQLSLFFTGLFLSKSDMASYGLLTQLVAAITAFAMSINESMTPIYSMLRTSNNLQGLKDNVYFTMGIFYYIFIPASILLYCGGDSLLELIKSNATLPTTSITAIFLIYKFLENQHIVCSCYLVSQNKIVDFESALVIGIVNLIAMSILAFSGKCSLFLFICIQAFVPLCYPNWKWPYEVCKEFKITYLILVRNSLVQPFRKFYSELKLHKMKTT